MADWYYAANNQSIGPVPAQEIKNLLGSGRITQDTLVWTTAFGSAWKPLRETELAGPPSPPPPPLGGAEQPGGYPQGAYGQPHPLQGAYGAPGAVPDAYPQAPPSSGNFLTFLFSFRGRVNRLPYWMFSIFGTLIYTVAVIGLVAAALGASAEGLNAENLTADRLVRGALWAVAVFAVLTILFVIMLLAVGVKRLHDRNKSGWWILLFYVVPGVVQGIGEAGGDAARLVTGVIAIGLSIWGLVELGFLRGTVGPNKYGPDPLAGRP